MKKYFICLVLIALSSCYHKKQEKGVVIFNLDELNLFNKQNIKMNLNYVALKWCGTKNNYCFTTYSHKYSSKEEEREEKIAQIVLNTGSFFLIDLATLYNVDTGRNIRHQMITKSIPLGEYYLQLIRYASEDLKLSNVEGGMVLKSKKDVTFTITDKATYLGAISLDIYQKNILKTEFKISVQDNYDEVIRDKDSIKRGKINIKI